jgi:hypothetical protein
MRRNLRYRGLDALILGASPEKLAAARRRREVRVPVEWGNHNRWQTSSGQVQTLMAALATQGGSVEAQSGSGEWHRLQDYMVKRGQAFGLGIEGGEWFPVFALREVR